MWRVVPLTWRWPLHPADDGTPLGLTSVQDEETREFDWMKCQIC